jgi:U3 small nucleolar RNA-associated protein 10
MVKSTLSRLTLLINDRVHEMNAEVVLQVFLPYHQSPNFPRMLSILTIPKTSRYYAPFDPLIKNAQPLPRSYITQSVSPSRDKSLRLLMDVAGLIQTALADNVVHRGLLAFWSATMVELVETERAGKGVGEGLVKVLVEAFVGILDTPQGGQDVNVSHPSVSM